MMPCLAPALWNAQIIAPLQPGWLMLRSHETAQHRLRDALNEHSLLPGRNWLEFDGDFLVVEQAGRSATN